MTEATNKVVEDEANEIMDDLDAKACTEDGHGAVVRAQKFTIRHCLAVRKDISDLTVTVAKLPDEIAKKMNGNGNGNGNGKNGKATITLPGGAKVQFDGREAIRDMTRLVALGAILYLIYANKVSIRTGGSPHERNLALPRTAQVSQSAPSAIGQP